MAEGTSCTVHGGECCKDSSSIPCQGWFCIEGTCSVLRCEFCSEDPKWFCGAVEGVTKENGLACKYRADAGQTCNNQTMPCQQQMYCSGVNNTCQMTEERQKEVAEEIKSRRITMAGMIVVLIGMFAAMRRMLKNEEARRRQIWEPVDSSAEASILRRLAEDTQRRVTGGWGQISGSLVEGGNAASAAVGTAFSRIRNNVMNATGSRNRAEDCDDDSMEMLPNGRRVQSRRELEADMRDFLLEASDDEDEDDERAWDRSRDEDGLLAHQRGINSSNSRASTSSSSEYNNNMTTSQQQQQASPSLQVPGANGTVGGFPDEPPAYDEIRTNGEGATSLVAGLNGSPSNSAGSSTSATMPSRGSDTLV
ncbi:hypothetical protein BGZ51_001258 [Haplosporangium sp. Z 767]|nr:hypothetical protein BGZ51_001258 [Haplosporangium sp. Z 767]KAF9194804.1 hypothetical protein BGZ50_005684 [Haplosporangium sp. Z 11]